jgi:hypothetical protein
MGILLCILLCLTFVLPGDIVTFDKPISEMTTKKLQAKISNSQSYVNIEDSEDGEVYSSDFPADYISYWKFDGNANDEKGINSGTLVGDTSILNDTEKGSVLNLDGIENYVEVADSPSLDIQHQITLSVWIKLYDFSSIKKIVTKPIKTSQDPWELYTLDIKGDTREVRFILTNGSSYYNDGWHAVTSHISAGKWYHVVGTYDGATMRLYINNSLLDTTNVILTIPTNNQPLFIGRYLTGSFMNGLIDDVMIYNRALGMTEIGEIYEAQKPSIDPEDKYMIGLFFPPAAANYLKDGVYTNYDHSIFFADYSDLVDTLTGMGFNTIVIYTHFMGYRYEFDTRLSNASYPVSAGFNSTEIKEMVRIAKQKGIKTIPALQVLSHQNGGVLSQVYPEYMLPEPEWKAGQYYRSINCVEVNGIVYSCSTAHISSLSNKPGYGSNWRNYWITYNRRTRDPFNQQAEQMVFGMIDELIETFTIDGEKPEAIHILTDELSNWLDCPEECSGMSAAEVFAMVINNVYDHIKENNPDMDIIMCADMLDENWNGGKEETPVAGAIDLLPKDIILDDWRYEATNYYGYDYANRTFPSVGKFMDKGYNVIVSSWRDPKAAEELIWTGKEQGLRTGKFKGAIYDSLLGYLNYTVPCLNHALNDYPGWEDLIPDSYKYRTDPPIDIIVQGIADVIEQTVDIINLEEYQDTDE